MEAKFKLKFCNYRLQKFYLIVAHIFLYLVSAVQIVSILTGVSYSNQSYI